MESPTLTDNTSFGELEKVNHKISHRVLSEHAIPQTLLFIYLESIRSAKAETCIDSTLSKHMVLHPY